MIVIMENLYWLRNARFGFGPRGFTGRKSNTSFSEEGMRLLKSIKICYGPDGAQYKISVGFLFRCE